MPKKASARLFQLDLAQGRHYDHQHTVNTSRVVNIEDLRSLARRRLPKASVRLSGWRCREAELTLAENCRAFREVLFRPRGAVAVGDCDLKARVLNHELSFPAVLAPVGYSRLMHPGGEVAAARAAGAAGTAYILSTISGHKLENVKAGLAGRSGTSCVAPEDAKPRRDQSTGLAAPDFPLS